MTRGSLSRVYILKSHAASAHDVHTSCFRLQPPQQCVEMIKIIQRNVLTDAHGSAMIVVSPGALKHLACTQASCLRGTAREQSTVDTASCQ